MRPISPLCLSLSVAILLTSVGCNQNRNYPPPAPANNPTEEASRYGEGPENGSGSQYPDGEYGGGQEGQSGGNRFGFSGDNGSSNKPGERDVREMSPNDRKVADAPALKKEEPKPEPPKKKGPPTASEMKYANRVAGDPLAVTLPGKHASLGAISVEKYDSSGKPTGEPLPRGTPVEIPDPSSPGQKIYFKVP